MEQSNKPTVLLTGGPILGHVRLTDFELEVDQRVIKLPVNDDFQPDINGKRAVACFHLVDYSTSDACVFQFSHYKSLDGKPFVVVLVGGPLEGERIFPQPAPGLPPVLMIPVKSEPNGKEGRIITHSYYERSDDPIDRKYYFKSVEQRETTKVRTLFEMVEGPFDGVTFDSDLCFIDRENAAKVEGLLWVTDGGKVGKRFKCPSPYAINALEDFGLEAIRTIGGFQGHKYEIIERLDDDFEVLIRAKYIPEPSPYSDT